MKSGYRTHAKKNTRFVSVCAHSYKHATHLSDALVCTTRKPRPARTIYHRFWDLGARQEYIEAEPAHRNE